MIVNEYELDTLIKSFRTIAIVGASDKPGRPVDGVGRALIERGFDVIPVHPKRTDVWGLKTYASVKDIPVPVDCVDLFRAAQWCPDHAREVLEMSPLPKAFWMQSGIMSDEACEILKDHDILVIEDRCLMVDVSRLGIGR
ncbi:CoA-binding protein [Salidesulfovibrio onnuriiensis]|uniref:CoA-binding protein n=1 Tax=Salidesulfovibrio onnuriiensis TaxID=2583823 RepID=UPI0011CA6E63|nr:CoA-binding protein [Salidesulfovibrio onnuriiensis]